MQPQLSVRAPGGFTEKWRWDTPSFFCETPRESYRNVDHSILSSCWASSLPFVQRPMAPSLLPMCWAFISNNDKRHCEAFDGSANGLERFYEQLLIVWATRVRGQRDRSTENSVWKSATRHTSFHWFHWFGLQNWAKICVKVARTDAILRLNTKNRQGLRPLDPLSVMSFVFFC